MVKDGCRHSYCREEKLKSLRMRMRVPMRQELPVSLDVRTSVGIIVSHSRRVRREETLSSRVSLPESLQELFLSLAKVSLEFISLSLSTSLSVNNISFIKFVISFIGTSD